MAVHPVVIDSARATERRLLLQRRARMLAGGSVAYNAIEAVVAVGAGMSASSIALVGFGLDSLIEMSSGLIILWQFRHVVPEERERQALRLIAVAFFAIAAYLTGESFLALTGRDAADTSLIGMGIAALSLVIMPMLSWSQRRTGQALGSGSVVADSKQTLLCTYMSAAVLIGLVANAQLGWWWADPVVGLLIAVLAVREGREAWRGEMCGCSVNPNSLPAAECCQDCACDND